MTDNTQYNFDQIIERRTSDSLKWRAYDPDVLPMWVADMDFLSPKPVAEALQERVQHGIFGYPDEFLEKPGQSPLLKDIVIERMARKYNWAIKHEDIFFVPGVVTGFNIACRALAKPRDSLLIQTPVYPPILHAAKTTQTQQRSMELDYLSDGSYAVDWDKFESAITPNTRCFILCNPHNPAGKVFTQEELEKTAEICLRHNIVICSDEIHCDLVYSDQKHIPIAALDQEIAQHTITLMAPSKTYNIAGLQCSIAIIQNPELKKRYHKSQHGMVPWVNLLGMTAAKAAYQFGDEWLRQVMNYLQGNRDFLYNFVQNHLPGIRMGVPQATYLAWLDCRQSSIQENPYKFFLDKARVAMNDGETFGRGGKGFVRLNFGCPRSVLEEALLRMQEALQYEYR